jgi:hypothetical protein
VGRYKNPHYKRDWLRRYVAAHPEYHFKHTLAGGRPSRATKEKLLPGQCRKCRKLFPLTAEHFVLLKKKSIGWQGWSAECRSCRYERFRKLYSGNREGHIARVIAYQKAKPEKKRNQNMKRYARKVNATPAWADQRKIETIYAIADFLTRHTDIEYQVDHIFPIMGKAACGLHVPENMRVITALANQQKGNR